MRRFLRNDVGTTVGARFHYKSEFLEVAVRYVDKGRYEVGIQTMRYLTQWLWTPRDELLTVGTLKTKLGERVAGLIEQRARGAREQAARFTEIADSLDQEALAWRNGPVEMEKKPEL